MKRKLIILGICFLIIVIAFFSNVIERMFRSDTDVDIIYRDQEMITVNEALYLTSFLGLDKDVITEILDYEEEKDKYLVFNELKALLEGISISNDIKKSDIVKKLSFDMTNTKDNSGVLIEEFLEFYQVVIDSMEVKEDKFIQKKLFVLGKDTKNESSKSSGKDPIMITNEGKFNYTNALNYSELNKDVTKDGVMKSHGFILDDYIDRKIVAMVYDNTIIYVKDVLTEATVLSNVWITMGSQGVISTFLHDMEKNFQTKYNLSREIQNKVGDLVIEDGKVVKISIKPDVINGKVLLTDEESIEIEKYGKLELHEDFKIYKIYGELAMEVTNSILVGYSATDFVVADGKIVAALIKGPIKAEHIRVIIKTNGFSDITHEKVKLTSDVSYTVKAGTNTTQYEAGSVIELNPNDDIFKDGRVYVSSDSENGKLQLLSIKRQDGNPTYRGTMEIIATSAGLSIINEVSIEEYLYAVIPSEMPSYYGHEALKVQAICARSYAYNQLFANGYREYGAHVDDSVAYQVYNNISETEASIMAVKDTYGKVLESGGKVITAYYFSTSSGHTASIEEVWASSQGESYLIGKLQTKYESVEGETVYVSSSHKPGIDFSDEEAFRSFITEDLDITYDSEFPWYRWSVKTNFDNIAKSVNQSLSKRYSATPNAIVTLVSGTVNNNPVYESKPIKSIGTLKNIIIHKRERSGIISELVLVGSEATIKVISEYNIRALLAPIDVEITRKDGSTVKSLSLLPSAYFVIDKGSNDITIRGGGYGHGVGMSQNGVKAMTDSGKKYDEVLKHFYEGVEIGFIYN